MTASSSCHLWGSTGYCSSSRDEAAAGSCLPAGVSGLFRKTDRTLTLKANSVTQRFQPSPVTFNKSTHVCRPTHCGTSGQQVRRGESPRPLLWTKGRKLFPPQTKTRKRIGKSFIFNSKAFFLNSPPLYVFTSGENNERTLERDVNFQMTATR